MECSSYSSTGIDWLALGAITADNAKATYVAEANFVMLADRRECRMSQKVEISGRGQIGGRMCGLTAVIFGDGLGLLSTLL